MHGCIYPFGDATHWPHFTLGSLLCNVNPNLFANLQTWVPLEPWFGYGSSNRHYETSKISNLIHPFTKETLATCFVYNPLAKSTKDTKRKSHLSLLNKLPFKRSMLMVKPFEIRTIKPRPKNPCSKYECFFCQEKDAEVELLYYYYDVVLMRRSCLQCVYKAECEFPR
jgi:hypothetical protein